MRAVVMDTSASATEHRALEKPFRLEATAAGKRSKNPIAGAKGLPNCQFSTQFSIRRVLSTPLMESTLILSARARRSGIWPGGRFDRKKQKDWSPFAKGTKITRHDWKNTVGRPGLPELEPTYGDVAKEYTAKELQICDPTTLVLVDEADRLRMASLEQIRAIFDAGEIGVILIGMPGLEKRLARYPQFYSRIGFVHEFRPLAAQEIRELLAQRWTPPGIHLPQHPSDPETVAAIIRITGGNFRLLNRLLTQMERILEINSLTQLSKAVVEAARESLVIGQN